LRQRIAAAELAQAEHRQTEQALRESERLYKTLIKTSPLSVTVTDLQGNITFVSHRTLDLYGFASEEEMLGTSALDRFAPEDQAKAMRYMEQTLQDGFVRNVRYSLLRKDGTRFIGMLSASLIGDLAGKPMGFLATTTDITDQVRAMEVLEQRAAQLTLLNKIGGQIAATLDLKTVLNTSVDLVQKRFGYHHVALFILDEERQALVMQASSGLFDLPPRHRLALGQGIVGWVALNGETLTANDTGAEPQYVSTYPDLLPTRSEVGVPIRVGSKILGVLDIQSAELDAFDEDDVLALETLANQIAIAVANAQLYEEARDAQERLQILSRRLVDVQEAERRHIARELHDEVGQVLTGLKLILDLSARLPSDRIRDSLSEAQSLVGELVTLVRDLSLDLRPAMLDDLGLLPALLWLYERYTSQTQVQVRFRHTCLEGRRFTSDLETAVYRLVQEALTNVARHARVGEVGVQIQADRDSMWVQIEDQGIGFVPENVLRTSSSSGLVGMHERVALLGGRLTIRSRPGSGTQLAAKLPLAESI
jgi:PAS domain S-box-containing protein